MLLKIEFLTIDTGFIMPGENEPASWVEFDYPNMFDMARPAMVGDSFWVPAAEDAVTLYARSADISKEMSVIGQLGFSATTGKTFIIASTLDTATQETVEISRTTVLGDLGWNYLFSNEEGTKFFFCAQNVGYGLGAVGIYDVATGAISFMNAMVNGNPVSVTALGRSPDHNVLIAAGTTAMCAFDLRDNSIVQIFGRAYYGNEVRPPARGIAAGQNADRVAVVYEGNLYHEWNRETNFWGDGSFSSLPSSSMNPTISMNRKGSTLVIGHPDTTHTNDGVVHILDLHSYWADFAISQTLTGAQVSNMVSPGDNTIRPYFGSMVQVSLEQKMVMALDTDSGLAFFFSRPSDEQFYPDADPVTFDNQLLTGMTLTSTVAGGNFSYDCIYMVVSGEDAATKILVTGDVN